MPGKSERAYARRVIASERFGGQSSGDERDADEGAIGRTRY